MKKESRLRVMLPSFVIALSLLGGYLWLRYAERRAEADLRDTLERAVFSIYDKNWDAMQKLNVEAVKEVERINRLREANRGTEDLQFWKRLTEQGDEVKHLADLIGSVRVGLQAINVELNKNDANPSIEDLEAAQEYLIQIGELLKAIQEKLDNLRST